MNDALADSVTLMRDDWNRRAKQDAYYYVAFVEPNQTESAFQKSAADVVRELEFELHRLSGIREDIARSRALEIGCGPGRLLLPLKDHFDEIWGVDISEEMIRIAEERLRSVPNVHVLVNSGSDLALFADNSFSFVYSYIVFQHIPSKEIVLNYLLEIKRVLMPGGIARFQVRGAPPSGTDFGGSATWNGCVLQDTEIVDFARHSKMELVALSGEKTQYMWVTLRKRLAPSLRAVTSTSTGSGSVPQRGPQAAISLWIQNAGSDSDLTSLHAQINGEIVRGTYLSPIGANGACQLNVVLPRKLPLGTVNVALVADGEVLGPTHVITVEPVDLAPQVMGVCDADNFALELRSQSGGLKVFMENVGKPDDVRFEITGTPAKDVDITPTNLIRDEYLFSFLLPPGTENGKQILSVYAGGQLLWRHEVEIALSPISQPSKT
jgi:SAM-dependent methyltransferase